MKKIKIFCQSSTPLPSSFFFFHPADGWNLIKTWFCVCLQYVDVCSIKFTCIMATFLEGKKKQKPNLSHESNERKAPSEIEMLILFRHKTLGKAGRLIIKKLTKMILTEQSLSSAWMEWIGRIVMGEKGFILIYRPKGVLIASHLRE